MAFVNIPNSVTEIGHTVFKDDVTLKSVSLGGVRRLGWNVFEGCTSLKELTIPNTLTEVDNDYYYSQAPLCGSSIETVVFEDGIENIPSFVCAFAHALKSVTIPEKEDILDGYTIGEYAFYNTAISDIEFPDSVTEIHNNAFGETKLQKFSSGNSLEKICYSAFKGCVQLKELELNNGLKTIEDSAFEGCTRLAFVNIPNSVTEVGHTVFKDDVTLKSVSLGGVRRLGWNVFEGCTSLKELTIPNTLTEVDNDYYYSQAPLSGSSIETVVFEDGIENIPSFVCAFAHALKSVTIPEKEDILDGYTIGEYAFYNTAISDIEFPDSVTEIHNNAFGETKLQKFSSGNSLEKICYSAFKGCVQLKELELNNGLKTIEDSAFEGCTRLAFVNIPNSVTEVGHTVFKDDVTLKSVSLGGVRRLGWNVFEGCTSLKELTIPNTLTEVDNDYYYSQAPLSGSSIETVVFEDGIENIPSFVCAFAHALKSVTIPDKEDNLDGYSIKEYAFFSCGLLHNFGIPDSVTKIERYAFAECGNIGEIIIPASVVDFDCTAFQDSNVENIQIPKEDSPIALILINNELPYTALEKGIRDAKDRNLDYSVSNYRTTSSSVSASGAVTLVVDYGFKASVQKKVSNMRIKIKLPSAVDIITDSVKVDGEISNYEDEDGFIYISVEKTSGSVRFSVKPNDVVYLLSYAQIEYDLNGNHTDTIGIVNMATNVLTVNVPNKTSERLIQITGLTSAKGNVQLYIDDELIDTYTANAVGNYTADVNLKKPEKDKIYKIEAKSIKDDGTDLNATAFVTYNPDAVSVTRFDMYYDGNEYDLMQLNGKKLVFMWEPWVTAYTFAVEFSNNQNIENVRVVSTKGKEKRYAAAVYDSKKDRFLATFPNDYIVGALTLEYKEKRVDTYLSDDIFGGESIYLIDGSTDIYGTLTKLSLNGESDMYCYEEFEKNVTLFGTNGLTPYTEGGRKNYISTDHEWFYRDNGVFFGKEYYIQNDDGTYNVFRYGIGRFMDQTAPVGSKSEYSNLAGTGETDKIVLSGRATKIASNGNANLESKFSNSGYGGYYGLTSSILDIFRKPEISKDTVYEAMKVMLNEVDLSGYEGKEKVDKQFALDQAKIQLEAYHQSKDMEEITRQIAEYVAIASENDIEYYIKNKDIVTETFDKV